MLKDKEIILDVSDEAKDWLAQLGYDVNYGARPLKRVIQKYLINPLSQELLASNFSGFGERAQQQKTAIDVEANMNVTLEDVFTGSEKQISVEGKKLKIKINPGTKDGQKLRLKGLGRSKTADGTKGDLFLNIHILQHPFYEIKENDLYYNLDVDLYTAVLGGKENIRTLDGKTISINIPEGTESEKILRLKGFGMHMITCTWRFVCKYSCNNSKGS